MAVIGADMRRSPARTKSGRLRLLTGREFPQEMYDKFSAQYDALFAEKKKECAVIPPS